MGIESKQRPEIEGGPHFDGEPFYSADKKTQLGEWLQFEGRWVVGYFNEGQKPETALDDLSDEEAKKTFIDHQIKSQENKG